MTRPLTIFLLVHRPPSHWLHTIKTSSKPIDLTLTARTHNAQRPGDHLRAECLTIVDEFNQDLAELSRNLGIINVRISHSINGQLIDRLAEPCLLLYIVNGLTRVYLGNQLTW